MDAQNPREDPALRDPAVTDSPSVMQLVRQVTDDLRSIAHHEVLLARSELQASLRAAVGDVVVVVVGGLIAAIGLGVLCVSAVPALEPVFPALWLRLLLVGLAYILLGGITALIFASWLRKHAKLNLERTRSEAFRTLRTLREELHRE